MRGVYRLASHFQTPTCVQSVPSVHTHQSISCRVSPSAECAGVSVCGEGGEGKNGGKEVIGCQLHKESCQYTCGPRQLAAHRCRHR